MERCLGLQGGDGGLFFLQELLEGAHPSTSVGDVLGSSLGRGDQISGTLLDSGGGVFSRRAAALIVVRHGGGAEVPRKGPELPGFAEFREFARNFREARKFREFSRNFRAARGRRRRPGGAS